MRLQLTGPWPIHGGRTLIPVSAILTNKLSWNMSLGGRADLLIAWPPPPNCLALYQEGWDYMRTYYPRQDVPIAGINPSINQW
jgi:hypothetical protein